MATTPLVYRTIREQIVEQLRKEVLSGEIPEGESLREQKLAARFGVSRGPIRDALLQLTQEGLLLSQANRGVRVSRGPSEAIQPLVVDLRRRIEGFALAQIFDSLTSVDLAELGAILAKQKLAAERELQSEFIEHDIGMHRWFVDRVGDADLSAIWLTTIMRMRLRYTRHASLMDSYLEHARILENIHAGDKPSALAALEANIV